MTRAKRASTLEAPASADPGTEPRRIAAGRGHQLDRATAAKQAAAIQRSGFPVPPHIKAALAEAEPAMGAAEIVEDSVTPTPETVSPSSEA